MCEVPEVRRAKTRHRIGWDATSGGNQIQSITLQQLGGAPTNQIATVTAGSTVNYLYDPAGNVINDGIHTYGYDGENRLVSVDGGATASYAYDQQNRRYKKTIGSTVTHYVWHGSQVLSEYDGTTGAAIYNYVYAGNRLIARMGSGIINWYVSDRLSTRLVLDTSGNVIGRQGHLPFGEDFGESGTQEKHSFTSYERDRELDLDYAINRTYSAVMGRFLSVDGVAGKITRPQRLNRYTYVRNNPLNHTDRKGLDDQGLDDHGCPDGSAWDPVRQSCFDDQTVDGGTITAGPPETIVRNPFSSIPPLAPGTIGGDALGLQDPQEPPPVPGTVPIPPISSPPITNVADLLRYWDDIRDFINSKGKCGQKLAGYMQGLNRLVQSNILHLQDKVANPGLLTTKTPWGTTVGGEFKAGSSAVTIFTARNGGRGTLRNVNIYFGTTFYSDSPESQAMTFMHELLHAVLKGNDAQIQKDLGTGGQDVTTWIDRGCPP